MNIGVKMTPEGMLRQIADGFMLPTITIRRGDWEQGIWAIEITDSSDGVTISGKGDAIGSPNSYDGIIKAFEKAKTNYDRELRRIAHRELPEDRIPDNK